MANEWRRSAYVAALSLLLFRSPQASGQGGDQTLLARIQDASAALSKLQRDDMARLMTDQQAIVASVYAAIDHEVSMRNGAELAALLSSLPKEINVGAMVATVPDKARFQLSVPKPAASQVFVTSQLWRSDTSFVLYFGVDYVSRILGAEGYVTSAPPLLLFRNGGKTIRFNFSSEKYADLDGMTVMHMFVPGEREEAPDVVVSTGPVGSGNFIYFTQLHFDRIGQTWVKVWDDFVSGASSIRTIHELQQIKARVDPDRTDPIYQNVTIRLHWGRKPQIDIENESDS